MANKGKPEAWRRLMLLAAVRELDATNGIRPCPSIAKALASKAVIFADVWEHLAECSDCQARVEMRLTAAHHLATAAIADCDWVRNKVDASDSFPEDEVRAHQRACPVCMDRTLLRVRCASAIAISDYLPGCRWLEATFREAVSAPDEVRRHLDTCAVCSTRISHMEGAV